MKRLEGGPVIIHKPKRTVCRIGAYDIIVSSDNPLEDDTKFNEFCQQFKGVLMVMAKGASQVETTPTVAHEGMS